MRSLKIKVIRALFWLWIKSRGYYLWSFFWRFVLERKYRMRLHTYSTLSELEDALGRVKWVTDPLGGVFDVISKPEKFEYILQQGSEAPPDISRDCDEFAQYAANRLEDMAQAGLVTVPERIYFMTILWLDREGDFHGHNVCAFYSTEDRCWAHIGNWYRGKAVKGFKAVEDIPVYFASLYEGDLIAWSTIGPDLMGPVFVGMPS